jgi:voltage-gated potassium channel Kch
MYKVLAGSAVALIGGGTIAYHLLEKWSWVDSLYFSVVAVTTVGFGDLTPSTDVSKLFTVAYVLSGVAIIATFLSARRDRRRTRRAGNRGNA